MYCQINSLIFWSKPSSKYFGKMWPRNNTVHGQSKISWAYPQLAKCIGILLDIGKLDIEDKICCQYLRNLLWSQVYTFWNIEEEKNHTMNVVKWWNSTFLCLCKKSNFFCHSIGHSINILMTICSITWNTST